MQAQAVSPHCHQVVTRAAVSVDDQPTNDAALHPIRQRELPARVATARAVLRRVRGVHSDGAPVGPCRLPGDQCRGRTRFGSPSSHVSHFSHTY